MPDKNDSELSFETAMKRLEEIVDALENQDTPLEESMKLYKEGATCARLCREKLEHARHELQIWENGQAEPISEDDLGDFRS